MSGIPLANPPVNPPKPQPPAQQAPPVCPILSARTAIPEKGRIESVRPGQDITGSFVPCLGQGCAMFHLVGATDADGKPTIIGNCSIVHVSEALFGVLGQLRASNALKAKELELFEAEAKTDGTVIPPAEEPPGPPAAMPPEPEPVKA